MISTKPLHLSPSGLRKLNLLLAFSLCISASFFALRELGYPLTGIDDTNIYFVYAKNLANGHGFVYNAGGERVEGFTSLLWTLISALAFKFSAYPEVTLLVIGIILVSLGIAYALGYLQSTYGGENKTRRTELFWSAVFSILIFTSPRYLVWNTITLMENALWSTLLLVTTIFVIRELPPPREMNFKFALLSILLLLTRPESIVWVPLFAAVLFVRLAFTGNPIAAVKTLVPSAACMVLVLGLLTWFRLQYFGYPLPNTYYAKVSPSFAYNLEQGTLYLIRYFISDPVATTGILAVFLACISSILRPAPRDGTFYLPLIAAAGLLIPVLTGGDHFGSFRFYQNTYPITALCLIHVARRTLPNLAGSFKHPPVPSRVRIVLFTSLVVLGTCSFAWSQIQAWTHFPFEIKVEFNVAEYERRNGTFIAELFSTLPRLPSIGVIASGGIKYSYPGEIIDLFGLNNTVMAHNHGERVGHKNHAAFEIRTFYQLQPDIVWPVYIKESSWEYHETELQGRWENIRGFKGLFNDPDFLELYKYTKVSKGSEAGRGMALVAWLKKDFLQGLLTDPNFNVVVYEYTP